MFDFTFNPKDIFNLKFKSKKTTKNTPIAFDKILEDKISAAIPDDNVYRIVDDDTRKEGDSDE